MTSESRREITGQLLNSKENSEVTENYTNSISEINTKVTNDKVNREEFLLLNSQITSYKTELENSAGNFLDSDPSLPITTVQYYTDADNTIEAQDSLALWKGARLTSDNVFYVPVVSNSEKLVLDPINSIDSDTTTNLEPIIPTSLNSFATTHSEQYNEKTTMDLIEWAKAAYFYGCSPGSITASVDESLFDSKLYYYTSGANTDPNYFTIGNYVYFYSGSNFFVGIVTNKGVEYNDPDYSFFIEVSLKTTNSYSGTIYFSEKIVASSDNAKNILLHLINYWKSLVSSQKSALESIISTERNQNDSDQITLLDNVIEYIDAWLALSDINKYLLTNLDILVGNFPQRVIDINARVSYLNNTLLNNLLSDRNEVIKVRLKKRGGTLNIVYREILSLNSSSDTKETDTKSYNYYKNKFIVKRIIDGCSDNKVIYIDESSNLAIDDFVYIICDDINFKEIKTYIRDMVNFEKPSNKELALEPNYVTVKKILLANSISSSFTEANNARIVKQLEI